MAQHNDRGAWGEQVAREYLMAQGYAIDAVNRRIGRVEIDFIARKGHRLCFVEVKTRTSGDFDPAESIDSVKRRRLMHAADVYMRWCNVPLEPQIDLIFITGTPGSYTLEHIPDAFYPTL